VWYKYSINNEAYPRVNSRPDPPKELIVRIGHNNSIRIFRNPTGSMNNELREAFREKYPDAPIGEPKIRQTYGSDGNVYCWMSGDANHSQVEPKLKELFGGIYHQSENILEDLIKEQKFASEKYKIHLPGALPIPEGMSRRFHYTKADDLDALRKEGLKLEKSESHKYGDPRAIWSRDVYPYDTTLPVVEYWEDPKYLESNIYSFKDVKPHQILTIHEPFHQIYHYMKENFNLDDAIKALQDLNLDDPRYKKTLEQLLKEKENVV
jgi:hypothetical protein